MVEMIKTRLENEDIFAFWSRKPFRSVAAFAFHHHHHHLLQVRLRGKSSVHVSNRQTTFNRCLHGVKKKKRKTKTKPHVSTRSLTPAVGLRRFQQLFKVRLVQTPSWSPTPPPTVIRLWKNDDETFLLLLQARWTDREDGYGWTDGDGGGGAGPVGQVGGATPQPPPPPPARHWTTSK